MALKNNTWKLNQWYDQNVAGNITYTGLPQLTTWGKNTHGLLGQNNLTNYSSPVQVPGTTWQYLGRAAASSSDTDHALAVKTDGTLWAWGSNGNGQLGQNSEVKYSSPIQIGGGTDWGSYMEVTKGSSFAIKTDGTLWAWGHNESGYGRLGLNNKTSYSSPTQIPGTTWDKISTHGYTTMATKTNGELWTWGNSAIGQLGLNGPVNTNYSSPKQVPGTTWASDMTGGNNWSAAIKTDGTLWTWGYNNKGQLGQNQDGGPGAGLSNAKSSPVQVGSDTTWSKISGHSSGIVAIKTDGTLWSWGQNNNGQLGHNNEVQYSSPTQVPGTTWSNLISIGGSTIATKTDGTLWAWGDNSEGGQLGQNNTTKYSSPTQIVGDWKQGAFEMGSTYAGFMAIKMV